MISEYRFSYLDMKLFETHELFLYISSRYFIIFRYRYLFTKFNFAEIFSFSDFLEARDKVLLAFETSSLGDFILGKCIVRGLIVLSGFFEELTFPPPSYFPFLMTFVLSLSVFMFRFLGSVFDIFP